MSHFDWNENRLSIFNSQGEFFIETAIKVGLAGLKAHGRKLARKEKKRELTDAISLQTQDIANLGVTQAQEKKKLSGQFGVRGIAGTPAATELATQQGAEHARDMEANVSNLRSMGRAKRKLKKQGRSITELF